MKLVTLAQGPRGRAGAIVDDEVLDVSMAQDPFVGSWAPETAASVIQAGTQGIEAVRRLVGDVEDSDAEKKDELRASGALRLLSEARLLAPAPNPGMVISSGRSYASHLKEMNAEAPELPRGFMKNNGAIIGPGDSIKLPEKWPGMVDFEGEFSFVFGRECHSISADEAMDYVAGYTIINDVSARDWVEEYFETGDMYMNQLGKQFPTFCPMGPCIVTADEIDDPHNLDLTTTLNGEVMQSDNTANLITRLPNLIAHFSQWYRFQPGDIFATGSPAGVGYAREPKLFMKEGDRVAVTVSGIGTLENPVVA